MDPSVVSNSEVICKTNNENKPIPSVNGKDVKSNWMIVEPVYRSFTPLRNSSEEDSQHRNEESNVFGIDRFMYSE